MKNIIPNIYIHKKVFLDNALYLSIFSFSSGALESQIITIEYGCVPCVKDLVHHRARYVKKKTKDKINTVLAKQSLIVCFLVTKMYQKKHCNRTIRISNKERSGK